ncbi:MAG: dihydrolipoamide acetyltransferase family protein [Acidimicrobiales bacterium]
MAEFRMPSLGADMDSGVLLEWRVAVGDQVAKGDIVAVVDTEKSDIEVEVFHSGTITELVVPEGEEVAVGTVLAVIEETDSQTSAEPQVDEPPVDEPPSDEPPSDGAHPVVHSPLVRRIAAERGIDLDEVRGTGPGGAITRTDVEAHAPAAAPAEPAAPPAPPAATPSVPPPPRPDAARSGRVPSSPAARRRAAERGVDIDAVAGSGPGGAVTLADVDAAPAPPLTTTPPPEPEPATAAAPEVPARRRGAGDRTAATRQATGRLMARSKREVPHYYLSTTIDMSTALRWLETTNRDRTVAERLLPAALLLRAVVVAASREPRLNGWWVDDDLRPAESVDLGVGVSLRGGGLIAPVIAGAERLGVVEIMDELRGIVARARAGTLKGSDLGEATITVTNLGDQGVESVYGVIAPPQVAVVGFGAIVERPWAVDGMLAVRPVVTATLSADHRATDGHEGARFLSTIDRLLDEPESL